MLSLSRLLRRLAFAVAAGVLTGNTAHAQILEADAIEIAVSVEGSYNSIEEEVEEEEYEYGSVYLGTIEAGHSANAAGAMEFGPLNWKPTPGKSYAISVSLTRADSAFVQFSAPPGFQVHINEVPRSRIAVTHGQILQVRIESDRGGAFGASSSFRAGPNNTILAFGLGNLSNGRSAGVVTLKEPGASNHTYDPGSLIYDSSSPEVERINDYAGRLRQVYVYNGLVDVTMDSVAAFRLKFYPRVQVGAMVNGVYVVSGNPIYEYLVENPMYPTSHSKVRVTRTVRQGGATHDMWTEMTIGGYLVSDWVDKPSGATSVNSVVSKSWSGWSGGDSITVFPTGSSAASAAYAENRGYSNLAWGRELTSRAVGAGGTAPVTTSFTYADRRVVTETTTGGGWKKFDYYTTLGARGQIHRTYEPYLNAPATAAEATTSNSKVTTFTYAPDWTGRSVLPASIITTINGTTVSKSEITYADATFVDQSRVYSSTPNATMNVVVATRKDYYDATHYLTSVTKTYRADSDPQFKYLRSLPRSEQKPDGTMAMTLYFRGTFNKGTRTFTGTKSGPEVLRLTFQGTTSAAAGSAAMPSYTVGDQTQVTESEFRIVPGASTAEGVVLAADGTIICSLKYICTGTTSSPAWTLIQRDLNNYAEHFFHASTMRDTGDANVTWPVTTNVWTKGRVDATIDDTGIRTELTYDTSGRVWRKKRVSAVGFNTSIPELTSELTYDAAGNVTKEVVSGTGTSETLTTLRTFDTAGRVVTDKAPGYATAGGGTASAVTTSYVYEPANRKVTITLPTGSTKISTTYLDGRTASVTGTAVVPEYYTYAVETDGRQRTTVNVATSTDVRKKDSWVDMLGRGVKTSKPGFTGQPAFEETNVFDDYTGTNTGRLVKTTKTGFADSLTSYDPMSRPTRSGMDLDGTNTLVPASTDRISDSSATFEFLESAWWSTTSSTTYPFTGGSAGTAKVMGTTKTRLTGLTATLRSEQRSFDAYGNESRVTTTVDAANKLVTTTTRQPGMATDAVQKALNGAVVEATGHDGLTHKKRYDLLGRVTAEIAPRTGTEAAPTVKTIYHPNTAWPKEVKDATNRRLSFTHYDAAGRPIYSEDAYGKTSRTAYTARGEVQYVWGSATYPVSYGYNAYGERTTMKTYREPAALFASDSANWPGATATGDTTTWEFDAPSGLLKKKYDAMNRFVEYTYNSRGQTATRMWARTLPSSSTRVTTTYSYFGDTTGEAKTGELKSTTYNDGTPSVTNTYTRLGQIDTIADVTGTRDFIYDATHPQRLAAEALPSFFDGRVLTYTYNASTSTSAGTLGSHTLGTVAGRPAGLKLGTTSVPASELEFIYETSNAGRIAGVTSKRDNGAASRTFVYGYVANSDLLDSMSIAGSHPFTISRTFEPNRDLLTSIEAKWSTTSRTKYAYTYDDVRRRATVVQSGDVFADYGGPDNGATHQIFQYNGRSELTAAATFLGATPTDQTTPLSGRRHEFSYDAIGNRKTSNTSGVAAIADQYTTNSLNQYVARENNTLATGGTADATAKVAVGQDATALAGRAGKHWGDNAIVPNGNGPYWGPLTIFAAKPGAGSGGVDLVRKDTRTAILPPAWQTFTYDEDGNILTDGMWSYKWDAENRLIAMETLTSVIGAIPSTEARRLEFKYDNQHRRVEKKVLGGWNGSVFAATITHRRFIYDGWSMIGEYDYLNVTGTLSIKRSYTWGLDLGGTLEDAGGIGALLQLRDHSSDKEYVTTCDANGNIIAMFDATGGTTVAAYEYSPFGEAFSSEGIYADENPMRSSTKFIDQESGLTYYGYRYYSNKLGRFIGRDPVEESGGLNLYGFTRNDPVNKWDILGLDVPTSALTGLYMLGLGELAESFYVDGIGYDTGGLEIAWRTALASLSDYEFQTIFGCDNFNHEENFRALNDIYESQKNELDGVMAGQQVVGQVADALRRGESVAIVDDATGRIIGILRPTSAGTSRLTIDQFPASGRIASAGSGMYTDGSIPFLHGSGSEAAGAGKGRVTVVRAQRTQTTNSSKSSVILLGTATIAGGMIADDATIIGIADDPLIPFVVAGGLLLAGGAYVYDHVFGPGGTRVNSDKSVQSRPTNAPPGTRPIDQSGLPRKDIHDIKDGVGAGPRDWTGITPDGRVITTDPDGRMRDHGPYGQYTQGSGRGRR